MKKKVTNKKTTSKNQLSCGVISIEEMNKLVSKAIKDRAKGVLYEEASELADTLVREYIEKNTRRIGKEVAAMLEKELKPLVLQEAKRIALKHIRVQLYEGS